jgi:ABC-type Mn2+/Zn2+ transport system ATPase subunit
MTLRPTCSNAGDVVLSFRYVTKEFGLGSSHPVTVLSNLTFDLCEGEITLVRGDNGAGKTTLLNLMAGLAQPTIGKILWRIDRSRLLGRRPVLRQVAYVRQHPQQNLALELTVRDHLMWGEAKGLTRAWWKPATTGRLVKSSLEFLDAMGFPVSKLALSQQVRTLSGGQAQLCALAMAILQRPTLVLLDEPTASLDAENRKTVDLILHSWHERMKPTIVAVSHRETSFDSYVTRFLVLRRGAEPCWGAGDQTSTSSNKPGDGT